MMTLKSIELNGFKSFGKKSTVSFLTPNTCIVGPNGSGKSNIVEAIRFVLGEQSMKSLRGKGGVDLIFKGSKSLSHSSRAQVFITFDNSKKIFSFTNSGLGVSLDYDEIVIGREVYPDGVNRYSINGTEVRLKDIIDLLASVNIGSSGHHIISQGEADRVLNASNKDRRAMIEDALGLKVYQYRIRESERKLEKTHINMKEVGALRREIAPHLAFLKKQVQIVERARAMREELRDLYKDYFSKEYKYINIETKRLGDARKTLDGKLRTLDERIEELQANQEAPTESKFTKEIKDHEVEIYNLRTKKDELARTLGRLEGTIESLEHELNRTSKTSGKVISESEWKSILEDIEARIDEALRLEDVEEITLILREMKDRLQTFHKGGTSNSGSVDEHISGEYREMKDTRDRVLSEIEQIVNNEKSLIASIESLRRDEKAMEVSLREGERNLYELLREKNEVASSINSLLFEEEKLALIRNGFEMELQESNALIGQGTLSYKQVEVDEDVTRSAQEDTRKKIERIKIKLEDIGSPNSSEMIKEYEDTLERDQFLEKESEDLKQGVDSLKILIQELKETLDTEFKEGVEKINKQFKEFFMLMFGGGSAFLSVVMDHKKSRKIDEDLDEEESEDGETEIGFERGIEINVTLPQKKVKDLHMLSGGERSLTSIALLFAISQVNPPPFLVLDETDAALDEANSRKYGNMLENLSKYSQLVVVTHNRETMSRAQVLYGVTMDASGASKLLSIRLEDASAYAK